MNDNELADALERFRGPDDTPVVAARRLRELSAENAALLNASRCPQCNANEWNESGRLRAEIERLRVDRDEWATIALDTAVQRDRFLFAAAGDPTQGQWANGVRQAAAEVRAEMEDRHGA